MKNKNEKSIKCSKCGTEFQGNFCPECGEQAENDKSAKKSKVKKGCLIVFIVPIALFTLLLLIGLALPDTPQTEPVDNSTISNSIASTTDSINTNPTEPLTEDVTEPSKELSESNTNTTVTDNISSKTDSNNTTTKKAQQNTSTTTTKKNVQNNTTTTTKKNTQNNVGSGTYVLNTNTKKIHKQTCSQVKRIDSLNKDVVTLTKSELQNYLNNGYTYCGHCFK